MALLYEKNELSVLVLFGFPTEAVTQLQQRIRIRVQERETSQVTDTSVLNAAFSFVNNIRYCILRTVPN